MHKKMKFLYRYYSNIDYALDVVINKRMYFSLQSEFNDPFDCLPKFSLIACKNDGVQYWSELLRLGELYNNPSISEIELEAKIKNTLNGRSHPSIEWLKDYEQEREQGIGERLKGIRICCFAKSPRNQMLWAHYASNHCGVVFQFRTKYMADGETGKRKMFPVTYYKKPISLPEYIKFFKRGIDDPLEYARFQYCSKSQEWSCENEVRLFSRQKYVHFPEQMLSGVIFGIKTPDSIIEKFKNGIIDWNVKPIFFKEKENQAKHKQLFEIIK